MDLKTIGSRILKEERPYAVILGLGSNGSATVRSLAGVGIPCIALVGNLENYEAYTRLCLKLHCPNLRTKALIDDLLKLGKYLASKAVLFPSNDDTLLTTSEYREVLEPYYHLNYPSKEVVRMILNKSVFYRKAMDWSFKIPPTCFPKDAMDIKSISGNLRSPYLIKPCDRNKNWRENFGEIKAFSVLSSEELISKFTAVILV